MVALAAHTPTHTAQRPGLVRDHALAIHAEVVAREVPLRPGGQCGVHLEDLYVGPEWRSAGLGRQLLAHMARLTLARDCGRLEWWALTKDERVNAFYEAVGAVVQDEWSVYRLKGAALRNLVLEAD